MKIRYGILITIIVLAMALSGCSEKTVQIETEGTKMSSLASKPTTNDGLFDYIISCWKEEKTEALYEYADKDLAALADETNFSYLFESVSDIGGKFLDCSDPKMRKSDGIDTYSAELKFENLTSEITLSLRDLQICGFTRQVFFDNDFEIKRENGVRERYFVLENDGYKLNAVYTFADDSAKGPAVLLIAGSGPSDYNETVGILTPFEEIARGLARNGIASLRVDKRTFSYGEKLGVRAGLEEEYLSDGRAALAYLKKQNISELYLLGHSLGGQIAAHLAVEDSDVDGLILFNSSARHLADIAFDQYSRSQPSEKDALRTYADIAKRVTASSAKGLYYYGASDYYWVSYNQIDTAASLKKADVKTLIVNSTADRQIFEADIAQWKTHFEIAEKVTIRVFEDMSHFGYKIDTADPSSLYKRTDFPTELLSAFAGFIKDS